ncbi:MAG TPA: hypothetical protein DIU15_13255 [Deltaproteobacteria bacterium]|nr:hypothetical protein [Deltaproteobacteria bacterium]HCP47007.1 hypothetical protein [Deltaproteobacteria bacterium]|tara:strand:+ start:147 stop:701 length:555 start_codon:yes stop_codon:yes gene_type:complete
MSAPRLKFALADLLDGHEQIDVDDTFGPFKQALNRLVEGTSGTASGAARVQLEVSPQRVDVDGQITGVVTQTCSRCAEDFAQKLDRNFRQLLLREQAPSSNEEGEVELQRGDLDREELLGTELDVLAILAEELQLALPVKPLCKDDCKGICSRCGALLNHEECHCEPEIDERWAVLASLKLGKS